MPFISPYANFKGMLLSEREKFPWISIDKLVYESPMTGETYEIPPHFRTDGSSIPKLIIAIPIIGQLAALRIMGDGMWLGFREGVLHDWLRRYEIVPAKTAHLLFREALYDAGYPPDICETYYAAVNTFNS